MDGKAESAGYPAETKCATPKREETVGEALSGQIAEARRRVELLWVKKAKAEALGILDHPAEFYANLLYPR